MSLVDGLLRATWKLVLLLILLAVALPMAGHFVAAVLAGAFLAIAGVVGQALSGLFSALLLLGLVVGIGVRVARLLGGRDAASGRAHANDARRTRLTARRPAEGVPPAVPPAEPPNDPDPALGLRE